MKVSIEKRHDDYISYIIDYLVTDIDGLIDNKPMAFEEFCQKKIEEDNT